MKEYKGLVWRHVPKGVLAFHIGYILKAEGRWNRAGVYGCIYTSFTQEGALAEYRKYLGRAGIASASVNSRDLVSLKIDISPLYDFTDAAVSIVPPTTSYLTGDATDDLEKCRVLADFARSQHYAGVIVPSAALLGEKNLNIYVDGRASDIRLDEGPDRIPIRPDGTI